MPTRLSFHGVVVLFMVVGCGGSKDATVDAPAAPGDAVVDANPNAPTCSITAPTNQSKVNFDADSTLTATATDPQDGTLTGPSVVWTTDLQTAPLGTGASATVRLPPGSNNVTCTAKDSSGLTGNSFITVLSKSPYARINHPSNNETRPANQAVPFVGVGNDFEDGSLSGAKMAWTSSIDQSIGTGQMFNRTLSVGIHTITLTVTDAAGNTDTSSITLTIQ